MILERRINGNELSSWGRHPFAYGSEENTKELVDNLRPWDLVALVRSVRNIFTDQSDETDHQRVADYCVKEAVTTTLELVRAPEAITKTVECSMVLKNGADPPSEPAKQFIDAVSLPHEEIQKITDWRNKQNVEPLSEEMKGLVYIAEMYDRFKDNRDVHGYCFSLTYKNRKEYFTQAYGKIFSLRSKEEVSGQSYYDWFDTLLRQSGIDPHQSDKWHFEIIIRF